MTTILDTSVAIPFRDGDPQITAKILQLQGLVALSIITRVELEGGVYVEAAHMAIRRARLDRMLRTISTLAFDNAAATAYGKIVATLGYSRRKVIDRMIAAQALAHDAALATLNAADFSGIPGLKLLAW